MKANAFSDDLNEHMHRLRNYAQTSIQMMRRSNPPIKGEVYKRTQENLKQENEIDAQVSRAYHTIQYLKAHPHVEYEFDRDGVPLLVHDDDRAHFLLSGGAGR